AEQLPGFAVRAVGDHRSPVLKVDHRPLVRVVQTLGRDQNAGLDQFVGEAAYRLQHVLEGRLHHLRDRLVRTPPDQHVLRHDRLLVPDRFSALLPTGRTGRSPIDTGPDEFPSDRGYDSLSGQLLLVSKTMCSVSSRVIPEGTPSK